MWNKVKQISKSHPDPNIRRFAKSLLTEMNNGNRDIRKITNFINNFSKDLKHDTIK
jgi:hypothetical protein